MSLPALDNLVRIGQLKTEPRNVIESTRMLTMARKRLADAQLARVSPGGALYQRLHRWACGGACSAALAWLPQ